MKAVVAAFNREKALVGAFSVITNPRMQLFEALEQDPGDRPAAETQREGVGPQPAPPGLQLRTLRLRRGSDEKHQEE